MKEKSEKNNYIIPYAKPSGVTSFKSMGIVKKILGTKKVGHTGTLDLFADGLLVLLANQYTRFADLISAERKEYRAWIEFGKETDTLDPEGELVLTKELPKYFELEKVLKSFLGKQEQTPPKFSAIKINGKRASDRIRSGENIQMKSRQIEIFDIQLLQVITDDGVLISHKDASFSDSFNSSNSNVRSNKQLEANQKIQFAEIKVACSKGTYIRSLARDIAGAINSCAYLLALRRTSVGNFRLEDSVAYSKLVDFSDFSNFSDRSILPENEPSNKNLNRDSLGTDGFKPINTYVKDEDLENLATDLFSKAKIFSKDLATSLQLMSLDLDKKFLFAFQHGKVIKKDWFEAQCSFSSLEEGELIAIFCEEICVGLITKTSNRFKYQLVFN